MPYLPRLSIEWMAERPDERYRVEPGTVVFVDISGFTKLSEGLAKHGKVGAEELTATIGTCFVALLDLAVAYGGRLLKFGGDALLLYFSGDAHEARGCRAAVEMRRALRTVGRLTVLGQKVSLRMSVGVHSGDFHFFLVGGSHRELIVTGPAASATVEMEGTADAGQIVVSPDTAAALRPGLVGRAEGCRLPPPAGPGRAGRPVRAVRGGRRRAPTSVQGIPVGLRDALDGPPPGARAPPGDGGLPPLRRHRRADRATRGRPRRPISSTSWSATCRWPPTGNEVTFLATDVDHDGGKIILTAGAPSTSGDDEHRMLLCVREVMDAGIRLPIRIGVNRGAVFVGEIGPALPPDVHRHGRRRQPGRPADGQGRPGQIVVSPDVLEPVARRRSPPRSSSRSW